MALINKFNIRRFYKKDWKINGTVCLDIDGCSTDIGKQVIQKEELWKDLPKNNLNLVDYRMPHHNKYDLDELDNVKIEHTKPVKVVDKLSYATVWLLRRTFDLLTGYSLGFKNEWVYINRVLFLETIAAIPGMVGAAMRHFESLRKLQPDYGFIYSLLAEAENERMHLMTAITLAKPGFIVRSISVLAQYMFVTWYTIMYSISKRYCHRFVGYLEEEAVRTYTGIIDLIDQGKLPGFNVVAPDAACAYWGIKSGSPLRNIWLAIRADEAQHREVNHVWADIVDISNAINPFPPGY